MSIRAVIDTSALFGYQTRRDLQQAAQLDLFEGYWSPWIIAELNRVLTWHWIEHVSTAGPTPDLSRQNQDRCGHAAKMMMEILLTTFKLVDPLPPYPPAWAALDDEWDMPIWAAARKADAQYVVSENTSDFPPADAVGRHIHDGIEYLRASAFLALVNGPEE
ncbi:MAG TPA: PIN domain-containing protein [Ktedonobacterales bacterium]|nr:PIN domain-containing protein [Ktedonobacterales bacterium]